MTWTDEIEREYQRVAPQLGALIQAYDSTTSATRLEKAVVAEVRTSPPTRAGLEQLIKSKVMQDLLSTNPAGARNVCLAFVFGNELVKRNEMTPQEVNVLVHELDGLIELGKARLPLTKSVMDHATPQPRPWDFPSTPKGLDQFLHSEEMRTLEKAQPAKWCEEHLDFYAGMTPRPMPMDISAKRLELECSHPDRARSTVAKAVVPVSRLSHGQSVLVQNFGEAIGNPDKWMIRR